MEASIATSRGEAIFTLYNVAGEDIAVRGETFRLYVRHERKASKKL
jgi:hypothetical protein